MNLYWVQTLDHLEDWFIIAETDKRAACLHEEYEGYDDGDAWAEFVVAIPDHVQCSEGWPKGEDVPIALGADVSSVEGTRVVKIAGKTYAEGMLEAQIRMLTGQPTSE